MTTPPFYCRLRETLGGKEVAPGSLPMRRLGASWWGLEVGPPHRHPAGISQDMGPPKASPVSVDGTLAGGLPMWDLCPENGGGGSWWLGSGAPGSRPPLLGQPLMDDPPAGWGGSTCPQGWCGERVSPAREGRAPCRFQFRFPNESA